MKRIVIALGGNALGNTNQEQIDAIELATTHIAKLIELGHEIVIVHGNGPQVGKIQLAFTQGSKLDDNLEKMPMPESIAMSQGYIGYHLQHSLLNYMEKKSLEKDIITILSPVLVNNDSSFQNPTKPIGPFYTLEEIKNSGIEHFVEDSGRGYRQVVPSPSPQKIFNVDSIKTILSTGSVVVCGGGGGIPLVEKNGAYEKVEAVVDKDSFASLLAKEVQADVLLILTAVEQVAINYGKENQEWVDKITLSSLYEFVEQGHFASGSMLPKIEAAASYVEQVENGVAIITSIESATDAIKGEKGTLITAG